MIGLASVVAVAVALASCSSDPDREATFSPDQIDEDNSEVSCSSVPTSFGERCQTIVVDGRTYRYALVGDLASSSAVIVDLGGPGVASLGVGGARDLLPYLPDHTSSSAVLVIEEPWATAVRTEQCWAEGRKYVAYTLGRSDKIPDLGGSCEFGDRFGWTQGTYRSVIRAILDRHDLEIEGFVGISFASIRLSYLGEDLRPDWVILNSPFPPKLTTNDVVNHQIGFLGEDLFNSEELNSYENSALSLGLIGKPNIADLDLPKSDALASAALSVGAYGEGELSLSRLAFFEEFCTIGGQVDTPDSERNDSDMHRFLERMYQPCDGQNPNGVELDISQNSCVVFSEEDQIIPLEQLAAIEAEVQIRKPKGDHGEFELTNECEASLFGS